MHGWRRNNGARAMNGSRRNTLALILAVLLPVVVLLVLIHFGDDASDHPELVLFIIPIMLCAYLGGLLPGLLCTAIATVLSGFFLLDSYRGTGTSSTFEMLQWSTFIIAGGLISYLAERLHLSQERASANEARLAAMFNSAMDGMVALDRELNIAYINPAGETMFGYKAAALQGTASRLLVPEYYRAGYEKLIRNFSDSGEPHRLVSGNTAGLHANGEVFPVEATLSRVDILGEPHVTLVLRDTSDRKRVQDALRDRESLYRSLFESLEEGVTLWDAEGRISGCNPAAERILGYAATELVGLHYADIPWRPTAADQAAFDPETLAVAIIQRTGEPLLHRERKLTRPDGRQIWIMQNGIPLPGAKLGARPRVMITFADITERRQSVETLARMANIVANSEDAIISKTLEGVILTWNPGATKMLGYAESEAIGQTLGPLLLPPEQRPAEADMRARIARGDAAQTFETVLARKDGKPLIVSVTASPLRDAGGKVVGVSMIARDITDRRQAEQAIRERDAAEEASRLKSEFLATMSHELRTPLTGVIGFTEFVRAGQAGPINDEQAECLDSMHKSSLQLLTLINGILDLSTIEAGKMELAPESFDVQEALEEACAMVAAAAADKGIRISQRVAPVLRQVTLDRAKFVLVLYNLVSNGVKFTGAGGHVEIDIDEAESRRLRMRVSDTGIGIDTADIDKLFRNFHQIDGSDSRRHEGAGLGLALTKKIVELQHGSISAASAPGVGSVFTVILPY